MDFYILGIAFAYIGGAMALQSLREMAYVVKHGGAHGPTPCRRCQVHRKKGLWIFGKHAHKAKAKDADDEDDAPRRTPSAHFNEMKESSGAKGGFTHTPPAPGP